MVRSQDAKFHPIDNPQIWQVHLDGEHPLHTVLGVENNLTKNPRLVVIIPVVIVVGRSVGVQDLDQQIRRPIKIETRCPNKKSMVDSFLFHLPAVVMLMRYVKNIPEGYDYKSEPIHC